MKNNLKTLLSEKGKLLSNVQNATGISNSTLLSIYHERNANPKYQTVFKIANYLNTTVDDLFNGTGYSEVN